VTSIHHRSGDVTVAIINTLETAGFTVGDGEKPDGGGWQGPPAASSFVGYVNVHPTPGGTTDGTIAAPRADAQADYSLISIGATPRQAEQIGDDVRRTMLATPLFVTDRQVAEVRLDMLGGVIRDDQVQPALFYVSDRYRLLVVPS
jgi:hypothetical protein